MERFLRQTVRFRLNDLRIGNYLFFFMITSVSRSFIFLLHLFAFFFGKTLNTEAGLVLKQQGGWFLLNISERK